MSQQKGWLLDTSNTEMPILAHRVALKALTVANAPAIGLRRDRPPC